MGALIGAQYACGFEPGEILEQNRRVWHMWQPLRDFRVPVISLFGQRKSHLALRELFGERQIEDLPREFFCVSTNLTRNQCVQHRSGLLRHYVLASMSIPGVAPPVVDNGDLLVDGGVLNLLPTDLMRAAGAGSIVAVDVSRLRDSTFDTNHLRVPSPLEFMAARLNPLRKGRGFPSIFHILDRTAMLASSHIARAERQRSDIVYIDPPVTRFDTLDMRSLEQVEELGYRTAIERIREWKWTGERPGEAIA